MIRFLFGFRKFFESWGVIQKYNLWNFVWIPLLIGLGFGVVFFTLGISLTYQLLHSPLRQLSENYLPDIVFLGYAIEFLIYILVFIFLFLILTFLYRPIVNIIMLPFLETLFDNLENHLGKTKPKSKDFNVPMTLIGILINLKYLLFELIAFVLSFFSGPLQPFILLITQGYFLGRTSFDYIATEKTSSPEEKKQMLRDYKMEIWGLGVGQFLLLFIPILGVVVSPLMGVIGSYLIYREKSEP